MLQAALSDCLFLDLLSHSQDFSASAVVDVRGRQIAQALVVAAVVVALDEGVDLPLRVAGQIVVFQQDAVFHGLMPALRCPAMVCLQTMRGGLAPGLGMVWRPAGVIHALGVEIIGQIGRDVGRTVVAEKARLLHDCRVIAARGIQRGRWNA